MSHTINIVNKPRPGRIDPHAIPEDVATDIEDTFAALKAGQNATITFEDRAALTLFVRQARTYCENRTVPLVFRKSPKKGAPDNVLYFTVTGPADDVPAAG
jgi:hypothetical protein